MSYKAILATGKLGELGVNNQLLFHVPEDLKHFKKLTENQVVVMGRKTHDSIKAITGLPQGLPNRHNYVLSRSSVGCKFNKVMTIYDKDDLDQVALERDVWVIGGAEVYKLYLDKVDEVYHTLVDAEYPEADTTLDMSFLEDETIWEKVSTKCLTSEAKVMHYVRRK